MTEIIPRPGLYRTLIKYHHRTNHALKGTLTFEHFHNADNSAGGTQLDPADIQNFQAALVDHAAGLFMDDVVLKRCITSTYVKDSDPYNPAALVVQEFNENGKIASTAEVAPWEFAMHIVRVPLTGKLGRLMVRGAFTDADTTETPEGVLVATATLSAYMTRVSTFWASIQTLVTALDSGQWVMAGEPLLAHNRSLPDGPQGKVVDDPDYGDTIIRQVTNMVLKGITIKQKEQ